MQGEEVEPGPMVPAAVEVELGIGGVDGDGMVRVDGARDVIPATADPEGPLCRAMDVDDDDVAVVLRCEWL